MTGRRRFSDSERAALYLAADGRCAECGRQLEPGWHADHMTPHVRGGSTDVTNGQALCPKCNLTKGSNVSTLRRWQETALARFVNSLGDFLLVACVGAGKTTFALEAARREIESGRADWIIVVVPTSHLRSQWAHAAARVGIQLDHRFTNGAGAVASDFDGVVVTYSAVASEPLLFRKLASARRTLAILDEIHHSGDGDALRWGNALRNALDIAERRLLLSGTPSRSDLAPIAFVNYDDDGRFVADYRYSYGEAIRDHVVRPVQFLALDGDARWREAGQTRQLALSTSSDADRSKALGVVLDPSCDWIPSALRRADDELNRHRLETADASGLVVAPDQTTARRYARLLERITSEKPTLAISDEPDSSDRITEFAKGTGRWIVAVQMVSEGIDIPRLAVAVYASKIMTEVFFQQVTGRIVRMRSSQDETTATLLLPSVEPLLSHARGIENIVNKALLDEEEAVRREIKERDSQLEFDLVEPLDASEAIHHSTILSGESFTDDELRRAQAVLEASSMPGSTTAAQMAAALRIAGFGRAVGTAVIRQPASTRTLADEKASLGRLIQKKVGSYHFATGIDFPKINAKLNDLCGDNASTATLETLQRRLDILDRWIKAI